ncbi:hypothetical protein BDV06DRAFT_219567 [Aspergillus oleicola]
MTSCTGGKQKGCTAGVSFVDVLQFSFSFGRQSQGPGPPYTTDTILYLGGSIIPYQSSAKLPNEMLSKKFENLPYKPDFSRIPNDLLYQVPNSNYASKYQKEFY